MESSNIVMNPCNLMKALVSMRMSMKLNFKIKHDVNLGPFAFSTEYSCVSLLTKGVDGARISGNHKNPSLRTLDACDGVDTVASWEYWAL